MKKKKKKKKTDSFIKDVILRSKNNVDQDDFDYNSKTRCGSLNIIPAYK